MYIFEQTISSQVIEAEEEKLNLQNPCLYE